jgi:hypothetical protein
MLPHSEPAKHIHRRLTKHIPSFSDVFDEESFYIFVVFVTVFAFALAYFASRRVQLKDAGHKD